MKGNTATAIAIVLLAATAAGASQSMNDTSPATAVPDGAAMMDPSEVHEHVRKGEVFELPTPEGSVSVKATERVQETISFSNGTDKPSIQRAPHVWGLEPVESEGEGLILSFNHTVRAWVSTPEEAAYVEPLADLPGTQRETVYEVTEAQPADIESATGVQPLSHIQKYMSIYAYVDTQYRDQYGSCCWADQIVYIIDLSNNDFDDVELEYTYDGGTVDTDFDTYNIDTAWDTLISKSWNGADVRSYWSYKDLDGCEIGRATLPGWTFLTQHRPDSCHYGDVPNTDSERSYFTSHELGKNNDAHPDYEWSQTESTGHEHRSIMKESLWGHLHTCWSQTNLDRMASYLGTSVAESPC